MDPAPILRPEQPEDELFVFQLFAEARVADVAPLPWSQSQKDAFLHQQFALQALHYRTHYPTAIFSIIQLDNVPIGRFYVDRPHHEIRVIDITITLAYQGRGFGHRLLRDLLSEAATAGQAVRLHVERRNPAWRLYHRLGFREINDTGVYLEMEWRITKPEQLTKSLPELHGL